jgi:glycosyltransferase involved in cell wall biosynthesis
MIDVVMLNYNFNDELADLAQNAIASLGKTNMGKLIIVDNASTVRAGMLRENADIYIRNKTNLGYPAAVNQGFALSDSEFVAIINNDIRISSDFVEVAEDIFTNDKVGTVHFRMIPYEQTIVPGVDTWIGGKERWCHCSFFIVRRDAFQGYDVNYGAGGYDDYAHLHKMRAKGWLQAYTNKCSFQHMDSITYRTMEDQESRRIRDEKNREYYKQKYGEYPDVEFNKQFASQLLEPYMPFP